MRDLATTVTKPLILKTKKGYKTMKKIYVLISLLTFASSPLFALRLYVKNETKKTLQVMLQDDRSAKNIINAKEIEHNKEKVFTTTLAKRIKGPLRFVVDEDLSSGERYTMYETPPGAYFFPSYAVNRVVEIGKDNRGNYRIRKVPEDLWKLTGKKGRWISMNKKVFSRDTYTEIDPWKEEK